MAVDQLPRIARTRTGAYPKAASPGPPARPGLRSGDDLRRDAYTTKRPRLHQAPATRWSPSPQARPKSATADATIRNAVAWLDGRGAAALVWGPHVLEAEKPVVVTALAEVLRHGNRQAQLAALEIVRGGVAIDVRPEAEIGASANQGVRDAEGMSMAFERRGEISERQAIGFLYVTIGREELCNPIAVEANLVHEGTHALTAARIIRSISIGHPENRTCWVDEIAASKAAAQYLRFRGGAHATFGTLVRHLDATGTKLAPNSFFRAKGEGPGTVQGTLKACGVRWPT